MQFQCNYAPVQMEATFFIVFETFYNLTLKGTRKRKKKTRGRTCIDWLFQAGKFAGVVGDLTHSGVSLYAPVNLPASAQLDPAKAVQPACPPCVCECVRARACVLALWEQHV